jgi:hypothetical protein
MTLTTYSAIDHSVSKFEILGVGGFLKRFSKIFPIETDLIQNSEVNNV